MLTRRGRRWVGGTAATVLAVTVALIVPTTASAQAGGECPIGQTNCDGWNNDGGDNGGGGDNDGGDNGGDNGGGGVYDPESGWLNPDDGCNYKVAEPQPDGVPEGQTAYARTCSGPPRSTEPVNLPDAPPGFDPPDPSEIGQELFASLIRSVPAFQSAPEEGGIGLVGLPVWLWIAEGDVQATWGELSANNDGAQGLYVEVRAWVTRIEWDMDDGTKVNCIKEQNVAYSAARSGSPPPCGYRQGYQNAAPYNVEATAYWAAEWETADDSGPITAPSLSATQTIVIEELQVVTE